jgi:hypothetical protein
VTWLWIFLAVGLVQAVAHAACPRHHRGRLPHVFVWGAMSALRRRR